MGLFRLNTDRLGQKGVGVIIIFFIVIAKMAKVIMISFLAHMAHPQCLEQIGVLCEDSLVGVVLPTSSDVLVLVRPSLV